MQKANLVTMQWNCQTNAIPSTHGGTATLPAVPQVDSVATQLAYVLPSLSGSYAMPFLQAQRGTTFISTLARFSQLYLCEGLVGLVAFSISTTYLMLESLAYSRFFFSFSPLVFPSGFPPPFKFD